MTSIEMIIMFIQLAVAILVTFHIKDLNYHIRSLYRRISDLEDNSKNKRKK